MRMTMAVVWLLLAAPLAHAEEAENFDDIVELSPNLYLLLYKSRLEPYVGMRLNAIRHANDFAASKGGVVAPVTGRFGAMGLTLKVFEYQFRVMSREEAIAARPMMADAVIAVSNSGHCSPPTAQATHAAVTAALQGASGIQLFRGSSLLGRGTASAGDSAIHTLPAPSAISPDPDGPGTLCLPGQICQPAQICLPGYQCLPGAPSMPEPTPPATTGQ